MARLSFRLGLYLRSSPETQSRLGKSFRHYGKNRFQKNGQGGARQPPDNLS